MGQQTSNLREAQDAVVIRRSLDEPNAFALIFERHFDAIYAYLVRRIGQAKADDLASSTFTVAFARRQRFQLDATTARPWLFGIATNLLRNERRTEKRALEALGVLEASTAAGPINQPSDLAHLGTLLARLDPDQRDVLILHAWEELSYEEIAQALGIPVGTVRSRLARARSRLRGALATEYGLPHEAPEVGR